MKSMHINPSPTYRRYQAYKAEQRLELIVSATMAGIVLVALTIAVMVQA